MTTESHRYSRERVCDVVVLLGPQLIADLCGLSIEGMYRPVLDVLADFASNSRQGRNLSSVNQDPAKFMRCV